jgi:putative DNA primase/helicase
MNRMSGMNDVHEAALAAHHAGLSVLPIALDGTKRPTIRWKQLQERRLDTSKIDWHFSRPSGLAIICGEVSGGLEMFEFEAGYLGQQGAARMIDLAKSAGYGDLMTRLFTGYVEVSASGGLHVLYRCPAPRTEKIARDHDGKTICETKGERGYVIVAPTPAAAHPTSANGWMIEAGGFDTIPTITSEDRAVLHAFARLAVAQHANPIEYAA